ncbi:MULTISPECIES: TlpA disulfide reductase family protein [unclassified Streptomyces]|uniref:TlpA family protein disulfide reductase n=1 Tax=unclassified Streptomyces TaxID=2593676 RepID=UPI000DC7C005|nr:MULTISPECIES: TlpA disulfide reductase family protein [unclassified Streptomyces]AWZ03929.1 TlpA family protein disulfide reductase [Streptomyces sp. ICC4]AWZ13032.1 TlpA family protein disulfide reductase [Streptomyces sp. ICC1]
MSLSRAPRRSRSVSGRTALLTAAALAGALTLAACDAGGAKSAGSAGSAGGNYVTGSNGISTAAKADRIEAPKLDGETVDGKTLDTTELKGKVVVLNVWGSWCRPCRGEAPYFAQVSKELEAAGQPAAFVGINIRDNTKENAAAFEETYGITYPSLFNPDGKLLLRFPGGSLNPNAIPSTIILDRDGKIAARMLAAVNAEKLRSMIDPVLAEK